MRKRIVAFFLAAALLLSLVGCEEKSKSLRFDLTMPISSLDPQFTTDENAKRLLRNVMEGLLVELPDGSLAPGVAESYTVSEDGLHYVFSLRQDACWEDGQPLTTDDFVFAFQRIFSPQNPSPCAGEFSMIQNADAVLSGTLPISALGVTASDDHTLTFSLSEPSPFFLRRLAGCGAMPCNRAFFEETKARYGLDITFFLANGPFDIIKWDYEESIVLEKNDAYWDQSHVFCPLVTFYIGREDPCTLFLQGKSDFYLPEYAELETLYKAGCAVNTRSSAVWGLAFCQLNENLADLRIRRALASSWDREELLSRPPERYTPTTSFVSDSAMLLLSPYHEAAAFPEPLSFDPQGAAALLQEALAATESQPLRGLSLLICESSGLAEAGSYLQKAWQENLLLYINLEIVPDDEFRRRLTAGEYTLALAPLADPSSDAQNCLSAFSSGDPGNFFFYSDPDFDALLTAAVTQTDAAGAVYCYTQAETYLIQTAAAVPLLIQPVYYSVGEGVSPIEAFSDQGFYLKSVVRD